MLLASLACVAACSSDDDDQPVEITRFLSDFHASRYSQAAARAAELDEAARPTPATGGSSFDRALAHNWHLQEWKRDPAADPAALQAEAQGLLAMFQTAYDNEPGRPPGGLLLRAATRGSGPRHRERGPGATGHRRPREGGARLAGVQSGSAWGWPTTRCRPATPTTTRPVDAAFANLDACFDRPIDRDNPDITPYLGQATSTGPSAPAGTTRSLPTMPRASTSGSATSW